jgi:hypothetical protein
MDVNIVPTSARLAHFGHSMSRGEVLMASERNPTDLVHPDRAAFDLD